MRLTHITDTLSGLTGSKTTYYKIQTAWVDRPSEGVRLGYLRCATCADMVAFRLHSEAGARARKRRWLIAMLIWAMMPAVVAGVLIGRATSALQFEDGIATGVILFVGLSPVLVVMIGHLLAEDGVAPVRRKNGPHRFKPLSLVTACFKPPATDSPVGAEIVFHESDPLDR